MKKTAGTLLHSRSREAGSMLQLQLRKKSLKEREPELLLKNKNNTEKVILFQPVIAQFVARSNGYKIEGPTGVTGTYPTQCHHDGEVLSL